VPIILGTAVLPVMSRFFVSSTDSLRATYEKSLRYLIVLGLPMTVGTMLLAHHIISLLYGAEFTRSIVALQILAWDILLFFLYSLLGTLLISIDRQKEMAVAGGICALVNVILNLILIPSFSYVGSSVATIACEVILFGLYFFFASKYLALLPLHKMAFKPIIACAPMALFVCFGPGLNLAVIIILAAVIYFAMLVLIRGVPRQDIALLNELITVPKVVARWFGHEKNQA
jgi:O-antigen/teichoic acid export membrane protein